MSQINSSVNPNSSVHPLVKSDMAFVISTFVQDDDYVFFALVCDAWARIWELQQRGKTTRAVKTSSTVRQLSYSFSLGLRAGKRITAAAASIGRIDLIATGRVNGCPSLGLSTMTAACRGGHIATVKWLFRNSNVDRSSVAICAAAAKGGSLECLQFLRRQGFDWDLTTASYAARGGFTDMLKWSLLHDCTTVEEGKCHILYNAAVGGQVEALKWLVPYFDHYAYMSDAICRGAVIAGEIGPLQFVMDLAYERGTPHNYMLWDISMWRSAALSGKIEILDWGWVNTKGDNVPGDYDDSVTGWAAMSSKVDALRWLVEHGFAFGAGTWKMATVSSNNVVLAYLEEIGCERQRHL
ncbi:unnamed protein product [Ectocarpus sp. 6 AP-2014]